MPENLLFGIARMTFSEEDSSTFPEILECQNKKSRILLVAIILSNESFMGASIFSLHSTCGGTRSRRKIITTWNYLKLAGKIPGRYFQYGRLQILTGSGSSLK